MRWQPVTIAILIGCLTTTAFNSLGWLQISERQLYDYYLRSRPLEPQDRKIVVVVDTDCIVFLLAHSHTGSCSAASRCLQGILRPCF